MVIWVTISQTELRIDNGGLEYMGTWFSIFSDILSIHQSIWNTIYQIKAEYLSYRMIPVIVSSLKEFKIYVSKRTKIVIFPHNCFERGQLIEYLS